MIGHKGSNGRQTSDSTLRSLRWLAIAIFPLVAGGLSVSCSFLSRKPPLERGMEALVKAYSKTRMIEPRLCGGFHAGKYDPDSSDSLVDKTNLETAQDLILREVGNRSDAPAQLARGRLNLAIGRCQDALPLLREASEEIQKADVLNDFGACLLQMGKYEEALIEFDKAIALDSSTLETRFNRALCYRKMLLVGPARVDLNSVLSEEREPDWKAEVQTRIDEMRSGESKTPAEILSDLRIAEESADKKQITAILDRNFTLLFGYSLSSLVKAYLDSTAAGDFNSAGDSLKQILLVGRDFSD